MARKYNKLSREAYRESSLLAPSDAILFQEGVSVKLRLPQEKPS